MKINKIKYSPNYYVVRQSADPQGKARDRHDFTSQTTEASVASDT